MRRVAGPRPQQPNAAVAAQHGPPLRLYRFDG